MMDPSLLLDDLNDKQREAVAAPLENLLVLAGAGSGKTRVLVHRIAWLMSVEQASPFSIMSVTFTNKAAAEMRGRIEELMMGSASGMWNGTFHGICHRILRAHYLDAKLPEDFQIIDSDDQQRLLKRLIKAQNLDEKQWPARQVAWWINGKKDEGLRPAHIDAYHDPVTKTYLQLYTAYQEACDRAGLVDFAEILLRAHELLRDNKFVREHYQARFKHILVDEFQDTNNIQYAWLRMMTGPECHVMIVGDDDQSIYGWRGAKVENIEKFTREFPSVTTIRLEQNYRSTKTILEASNTLIANNTERMGKELWTDGVVGEPISVYSAYNELDEARFAVNKIKEWQDKGGALNDAAMLYRNNAQSRVLEEALIQAGLPYRIYGGMRFFERQEIKDALAYMRLMANRNDDAAFERVVNTPTRGLGDKTLETIRRAARDRGCTMWEASVAMLDEQVLAGRAAGALGRFIELITALEDDTLEMPLHEQTDHVIKYSGLFAMYEQEKGEKSKARIENLEELVTATRQFEKPEEAEEMSLLTAFLTHAALEAGEGQADEFEDAVQLMTLHSAKGLEFPLVFMVGVEEGMFPSQMSAEEAGRLEEERRLCYVGMTRAMQKLYITYAEMRRLYGQDKYHKPSRFIRELPETCLDEVRMKAQVSRPASSGRFSQTAVKENFNETGFSLGSRVMHPKFGEGTI
ncbi:DNA helicase II, partial [Vibrio parahaemolyticus]|nr:DNA helicase II [Vibrio parahaemolyticus]MCF9572970.1 DNA helicase II [Vibrio parahaemolyticus]